MSVCEIVAYQVYIEILKARDVLMEVAKEDYVITCALIAEVTADRMGLYENYGIRGIHVPEFDGIERHVWLEKCMRE